MTRTNIPHGLQVETGGISFPVAPAKPELSWILPDGINQQDGYEIEASVNGDTRTYEQRSSRHRFVSWPWEPLASTDAVHWRVRVDGAGERSDWSGWSSFEAGLFEGDWSSSWISSPAGDDLPVGERPAYSFSTEFDVEDAGQAARLYSSALGVYEARLNGDRVDIGELAPGTESYDSTLYAQAADVTDLIRPGRNVLELVLSDGWFRGRAGAFRKQAAWGTQTSIRAELHIRTAATSMVAVATDLNWRVRESGIVSADLMDGQVTDLRIPAREYGAAIAGPEVVPPVSWSPAPPVQVVEEIAPQTITRLTEDVVIVDFGQNASGRVRLSSLGSAGTRTVLDFGEHLDREGQLDVGHLDTVGPDGSVTQFSQHDEVVSDGDLGVVFEPHHTIHGFQYVRVERPGIALNSGDITMQVIHTDLTRTGSFECSDPELVRLYDAATWSFRGNAVDIPTDCPTRERAGWTGDWQIFLPTAVRLFDVDGFTRKWLQSVRDDQLDDGRIVNISPDNARLKEVPDTMSDMATGSAGWGDAIVLVPWELYRNYGDTRVLEESWDAMSRWVKFALRSAATHRHPSRVARSTEPLPHEEFIWDGTFHFGEWNEPAFITEDGTAIPWMSDPLAWAMSDKGEVGTAYLYKTVATMALIAETIGKPEQALTYELQAEKIRASWQREFLKNDGQTTAGTQASYVRALAFGLVPADLQAQAAQHLVDLVTASGYHLGTGFLSTADLLPVLADTGHAVVAHQLLLQRTTPSWLGMIDRGATTIWEEWEGIDRNGLASGSLNHYSKGAVIRYLQTHILGLAQDADSVAWEQFTVAPTIPTHLTWARGHFDSPQGRITVEWNEEGPELILHVSVPTSATALVSWGDMPTRVGAGLHEFRAPASAVRAARVVSTVQ
jgi:alpha-L-rhamnosidase